MNYFWMVTVQDWSKTSPALLSIVSNVIDLDNLFDKKLKMNAVFLIIIE